MNNNDLIRRGDVFRELDSFLAEVEEKMSSILEQYGACANRAVTNCEETTRGAVNNIHERINAIPAVQPMSAVEYVQRFHDWCTRRFCDDCSFRGECHYAHQGSVIPHSAIALMQKWAAEHFKEVNNEID